MCLKRFLEGGRKGEPRKHGANADPNLLLPVLNDKYRCGCSSALSANRWLVWKNRKQHTRSISSLPSTPTRTSCEPHIRYMPSPVRASASTSIRRLSQTARQLSNGSSPTIHTMASAQDYKTRAVGAPNTLDYRVYLENTKTGLPASPFHDVPLFADESKTILNMIVEIPRMDQRQGRDLQGGELQPFQAGHQEGQVAIRAQLLPAQGLHLELRAFPQTWEDPHHTHPDTKAKGDNDPLDVCEIGEQVGYTGQIKQVKFSVSCALLDEGETDWKVIVIDVNDPLASKLNDIEDVERPPPRPHPCHQRVVPHLQDPRWKAEKPVRLLRRGQEPQVRHRDRPRVQRGLEEAHRRSGRCRRDQLDQLRRPGFQGSRWWLGQRCG